MGRQHAAPLEFNPKPSEAAFSLVFFRCSFRPEVVSDVMSGANVGHVGMDEPVKFGASSSNCSHMRHFRPFFLKFDNCQPEVGSYVISGRGLRLIRMPIWMYMPILVILV